MLFGWWAGYFIYAMLFAYYIWTHDYYHLPMVPLIAVSLAPATAYLEGLAERKNIAAFPALIVFVCVCLAIAMYGSVQTVNFLSTVDHRDTRASLEQLGEVIRKSPSGKIIGLTDDYETSFTFYNFLKSDHWPSLGDMNFRELQGADSQAFEQQWQITEGAGYFFVTDYRELEKQPALKEKLSGYPILAEDEVFTLYSLADPQQP
jgi:hypothetical protein